MYNQNRSGHFDRQGGGGKFRDRGSFEERRSMHAATCNACGKDCEVPFKPNGRKPVFCDVCFKKEAPSEPRSFGRMDSPRPAFHENREQSFVRHEAAPQSNGMEQVTKQLQLVNTKLEAILLALTPKSAVVKPAVIAKEEAKAEPEKKEIKKKKAVKKAK